MTRIEISSGQQQIIGLDLLRGAAALIVFLTHLRGGVLVEFGALPEASRTLPVAVVFGVTRLAHEAVLVFFVLSGFLVGGQVIRQVRSGTFSVTRYAIDRCSRILVPLVPACLISAALAAAITGEAPSWSLVLGNTVGLNEVLVATLPLNAPLWSIAYEIWFYVAAGALGSIWAASGRSAVSFWVLGGATAALATLHTSYFLFWALGAVAVVLRTERPGALALVGLMVAVTGATSYQLGSGSRTFASMLVVSRSASEVLICSGICLTLPWLVADRTNRLLQPLSKLAHLASNRSYSLYCLHAPVLVALQQYYPKSADVSGAAVATASIQIAVTLIVVEIFYRLFEANTGAIRRFLRSKFMREHRACSVGAE